VGAHAVVTKSIPAGETWVGIPAKPIRTLQTSS
jgi:acetyltransferase-like isoleucine patch superfamily enzyme